MLILLIVSAKVEIISRRDRVRTLAVSETFENETIMSSSLMLEVKWHFKKFLCVCFYTFELVLIDVWVFEEQMRAATAMRYEQNCQKFKRTIQIS